jgi:NAD dependent epimerase/dehydratase family
LSKARELDLRCQQATKYYLDEKKPDVVIVAAARVGGIVVNDTFPVDFLSGNLAIAQNLITASHRSGVHDCPQSAVSKNRHGALLVLNRSTHRYVLVCQNASPDQLEKRC